MFRVFESMLPLLAAMFKIGDEYSYQTYVQVVCETLRNPQLH